MRDTGNGSDVTMLKLSLNLIELDGKNMMLPQIYLGIILAFYSFMQVDQIIVMFNNH